MQNSAVCNPYTLGSAVETPSLSKHFISMNQYGLPPQSINSEMSMPNSGTVIPLTILPSPIAENQGLNHPIKFYILEYFTL